MLSTRFHFRKQEFLFKCKLSFMLLCLSFVVLFCFLGNWQLYRYHFKQNLLTDYEQRAKAVPQDFLTLVANEPDLQFQRAMVKGEYLNDLTMLVQNRFHDDKPGFEVLTPFKIDGEKKLLLIDRGWIEKLSDTVLPAVSQAKKNNETIGNIKLLNEYQFILGDNILSPNTKPIVMQRIDTQELSAQAHLLFYPFILRLDAKDENGFVRDWTITAVNPERHLGYAVQWFLMAAVLVIAFFSFCIERVRADYANVKSAI